VGGCLELSGVRQNLARILHVLRFFKTAICNMYKIRQDYYINYCKIQIRIFLIYRYHREIKLQTIDEEMFQ